MADDRETHLSESSADQIISDFDNFLLPQGFEKDESNPPVVYYEFEENGFRALNIFLRMPRLGMVISYHSDSSDRYDETTISEIGGILSSARAPGVSILPCEEVYEGLSPTIVR